MGGRKTGEKPTPTRPESLRSKFACIRVAQELGTFYLLFGVTLGKRRRRVRNTIYFNTPRPPCDPAKDEEEKEKVDQSGRQVGEMWLPEIKERHRRRRQQQKQPA